MLRFFRNIKKDLTIDEKYCINIVRSVDYENFLCTLPLAEPIRRFAFAIRALNAEISGIADKAANPEYAHVRFQYWLDTINSLYAGQSTANSPIESELFRAIKQFKISRHWLSSLITARQEHADSSIFADMKQLERYADKTNSSIHFLLAESFGFRSFSLDHALSHMGRAQCILAHLRSVVPLANQRRIMTLPTELLLKHEISEERLLRICQSKVSDSKGGQDVDGIRKLRDISFDMASQAQAHSLAAIRQAQDCLQQRADMRHLLSALLLPIIPLTRRLACLSELAAFDIRHEAFYRRDGLLPLRIAIASWRRRIPSPPAR